MNAPEISHWAFRFRDVDSLNVIFDRKSRRCLVAEFSDCVQRRARLSLFEGPESIFSAFLDRKK